jgi:ketosteroid isomerase-like protein
MMSDDTTFVVQRFLDALGVLDVERMLADVANDIVVQMPTAPPGLPRQVAGKADFTQMLAGMSLMWTSFSLTRCAVHPLADDPARAVVEYASDSVNSDGSPYRNTYLSIATVKDGKLTNFQEFFDAAPVMQSLAALQATTTGGGVQSGRIRPCRC